MKIAEAAYGPVLVAAAASKLSPLQSLAKNHASCALETLKAVLTAAEEAPARMVAAAMAGILVFSIGFVELVIKLFG